MLCQFDRALGSGIDESGTGSTCGAQPKTNVDLVLEDLTQKAGSDEQEPADLQRIENVFHTFVHRRASGVKFAFWTNDLFYGA
jgi:hypothetical protein